MYSEPLFIQRLSSFEKTAATIKLPDDETKWAPIVLSELHRQAPMMRDFHSEITLDRTDVNKGVGFGYISSRPKTPNPLAASGLPSVKIPIFIKNWHLSPIDICFDASGRGYFLSERRIREVLARPQLAAGATDPKDPVSGDIRTMLTPPWENVGQFYRGVNTAVSQNAQVKTSSLLRSIDGTVDTSALEKLASWVSSDEGRSMMWGRHEVIPVFSRALRLEAGEPIGGEKVAEFTGSPVVQYRWDGGPTMLVKIAQPGGFAPQQGQVPADQAAQQMDPNAQAQVAQDGQATQADQMQVMSPEELDGDDFQPVAQFGIYRVITVNNEQLMGWVFPFILSFKMEKVPQQIFTDGSNFATQQAIAGVHVATNANLPSEQPQGRGFFYIIRNGRAFAFAPIDLQGEQQQPDGNTMYMAQTILGGNQVQIMKIDGMKAAAEMGENQFALPGDVKWCSFKQQTNPLVEDPMQAGQRAGAYTLQKIQQKAMMQQQAQEQEAEKGQKGQKGQKKTAAFKRGLVGTAAASAAMPATATHLARKKLKARGYSEEEARNITGGYARNAVQGLTQGAIGMGLAGHVGGGDKTKGVSALLGGGARAAQIMQDANKFIIEDRARKRYMDMMDKRSSAPITAVIKATQDNTYTLMGNAFNKLASAHTHFLDYADTEWMLALAGIDPTYTREKLATIHTIGRGQVEIPVLRPVTPPETRIVKTAALEKVCSTLSRFMAKHANELRDPNIADTLLALNFLNPRNVSMFIGYLPVLEETTSSLANLLVAARLGEQSLDEGACKEALRNLEDVITGLKMLAMTRESV
jgi:hypothetical protein